MKCNSCSEPIDPKWSHAINNNLCPWCGSSIMDQNLQYLLVSLKETMDNLKEYPDHLNDWLFSNYKLISIDSPDIANYVPKEMLKTKHEKKQSVDTQPSTPEKAAADERTNEFFKRAGAISKSGGITMAEKSEHLKNILKKVQSAGSNASSEENAEFETQKQMVMQDDYISSSISEDENDYYDQDDDEEAIPMAVLNMSKGIKSTNNAADVLKIFDQKRKAALNNFKSGGGSFSRG